MATEDARYRQSTQYRLWSFSPAQLAQMRDKTNAFARTNISSRLSSLPSKPPSSSDAPSRTLSPTGPEATGEQPTAPADQQLPEFLTPAEELQLLNFYTVELLRAAAFCELPTDIRATAAIFLRRFYITNSIMTYPPTELLKTCLFFGAKAEGFYTRLSQLADKFPNTTPEEILAGEFLVCQGIRFAFDVRHPYRALEGAIMELRRYEDVDEEKINAAHARARDILKFSPLVTDAYFHYTPSQIMLAALSLADRALAQRLLDETLRLAQPSAAENGPADFRDKLLSTVEACREALATEPPERMRDFWGTPESNKIVRPLIRKLKKCRDPDRWDLVALQRAKREQIAGLGRKASENGAAAAAAGTAGEDDGAVFGDVRSGGAGAKADGDWRETKRRKVSSGAEDPFGGPL